VERTETSENVLEAKLMKRLHVAILALMTAVPGALPAQGLATDRATLSPGDVLRIAVWRKPEFSGEFVIAPDSTITHPLYRAVKVGGIPLGQVEERVRTFLKAYETDPSFVLSPLLRVFVGGEVRSPNVFNVPPGTTVAQTIALAGGPTERAKLEQVVLIRHQVERSTLDMTLPDSPAATLETRSGDQVLVSRRRNLYQEVIAPASSIFAAAAALASVIIQLTK
jgi:polysaccharide export outer membrane protein